MSLEFNFEAKKSNFRMTGSVFRDEKNRTWDGRPKPKLRFSVSDEKNVLIGNLQKGDVFELAAQLKTIAHSMR